jgi:hypothetical protein
LENIIPDNIQCIHGYLKYLIRFGRRNTASSSPYQSLYKCARCHAQGGELTVTAENTFVSKEMAEDVANAAEGEYVVFSISDTGAGIPASDVHKIFEPFYTTKELGKGTGLGLSISIGVVKGHKGFITVESVKGKGSTFKIFLPAATAAHAGSEEADFQPDINQPLIFVACSENEYNYKLFDELEDHGYETAFCGWENTGSGNASSKSRKNSGRSI